MSFLRINRHERVLRITLNRPDKRNALTTAMCHELVDAVEGVQDDADIGSVLIDAEGRAFCAGMDLDEAVADKAQNSIAIHEKLDGKVVDWLEHVTSAQYEGRSARGGDTRG